MAGQESGTANKKPTYKAARESEEGELNFVAKIDELTFGPAESWAKGKNLSLPVQPSYDAVARLNELPQQKRRLLPRFT